MDQTIREIIHYFILSENKLSPFLTAVLEYSLFLFIICFAISGSFKQLDILVNTNFFQSAKLLFIQHINVLWDDSPLAYPSKKNAKPYWTVIKNIIYLVALIFSICIIFIAMLLYFFLMSKMEPIPQWYLVLGFGLLPYCSLNLRKFINEVKILKQMKFRL